MTPRKLQDSLTYPPRALKADRAAAYLGMSRSKFLELVDQRRMPGPKIIDGMSGIGLRSMPLFDEFPDRNDDNVGRPNTFDTLLRD
jgi:hypothetical protein